MPGFKEFPGPLFGLIKARQMILARLTQIVMFST